MRSINRPSPLAGRPARINLSRPVVLVTSDGTQFGAKLLDLSARGFRVTADESLEVGEIVTLRVDKNAAYAAQIVWVRGTEAGGVFLNHVEL